MKHSNTRKQFMAQADSAARDAKAKSPMALKTISEAADMLDVPQHVLRFWETKFAQIKPLKRNGGRRYYRPDDIETLVVIKNLLYKQGFTIKGAKKAIEKRNLSELTAGFSDVAMGEPTRQDNDNEIIHSAADAEFTPVDLASVRDELAACRDMLRRRKLS